MFQTFQDWRLYIGTTPHAVTVTTRIITFLVGDPYKPSFATVTGWGVHRSYISLGSLLVDWLIGWLIGHVPLMMFP